MRKMLVALTAAVVGASAAQAAVVDIGKNFGFHFNPTNFQQFQNNTKPADIPPRPIPSPTPDKDTPVSNPTHMWHAGNSSEPVLPLPNPAVNNHTTTTQPTHMWNAGNHPVLPMPFPHSDTHKSDLESVSKGEVIVNKTETNTGTFCGMYGSYRDSWRPNFVIQHCPGDYSVNGVWFCPKGYIMAVTGQADTWHHTGKNHYLEWTCVKTDSATKDVSSDGRRLLITYHGQRIWYGPKGYFASYDEDASKFESLENQNKELSSTIDDLKAQLAKLEKEIAELKTSGGIAAGTTVATAVYENGSFHLKPLISGFREYEGKIPNQKHWWETYFVLKDPNGNIIAYEGEYDTKYPGRVPPELKSLGVTANVHWGWTALYPCVSGYTRKTITFIIPHTDPTCYWNCKTEYLHKDFTFCLRNDYTVSDKSIIYKGTQ